MRLTIAELCRVIHEELSGSHFGEAYDKDLVNDPTYNEKSVYVPNDIKDTIRKWSKAMGLTWKRKRRSRSA